MGIEKAALMLIEFDSLQGPIIRKKSPNGFEVQENKKQGDFLMWVLRASEFSVRKVGNHTAYARALSLRDPNFPRKNRQFGFAIVTKTAIEFQKVNEVVDKLIKKAKKRGNNKPYFIMLNELLTIFKEIKDEQTIFELERDRTTQTKERNGQKQTAHSEEQMTSKKMTIFNKIKIAHANNSPTTIITRRESGSSEAKTNKQLEVSTDRISIFAELQANLHNGMIKQVRAGLMIFARILETFPSKEVKKERIRVGVEYFDLLLHENVDIPYFLPFLQYLFFMESFTIEVFKRQSFKEKLSELVTTHGKWVEDFTPRSLEGKQLSAFFQLVGIKREALGLLIDLLFIGIIELF